MTTQTERVSDERLQPDLASLLERVKAATGPDRELDLALATAIVPDVVVLRRNSDDTANEPYTYWEYTTSIDDALALVERLLPDWAHANGNVGEQDMPWACLTEPVEPCRDFASHAVTEPLAILAALLSALSKEPTHV